MHPRADARGRILHTARSQGQPPWGERETGAQRSEKCERRREDETNDDDDHDEDDSRRDL